MDAFPNEHSAVHADHDPEREQGQRRDPKSPPAANIPTAVTATAPMRCRTATDLAITAYIAGARPVRSPRRSRTCWLTGLALIAALAGLAVFGRRDLAAA